MVAGFQILVPELPVLIDLQLRLSFSSFGFDLLKLRAALNVLRERLGVVEDDVNRLCLVGCHVVLELPVLQSVSGGVDDALESVDRSFVPQSGAVDGLAAFLHFAELLGLLSLIVESLL